MWVSTNGKRTQGFGKRGSPKPDRVNTTTSAEWEEWLCQIRTCGIEKPPTDPRPFTKLNVLGRPFKALIDTGAVLTLIDDNVAKHLRRHNAKSYDLKSNVLLANNTQVQVTEAFTFEAKVGEIQCEVVAAYLPALSAPVVLGMDVIKALNLITINAPCANEPEGRTYPVNPVGQVTSSDLAPSEAQALQNFLEIELPKFERCSGKTHLLEHRIKLKDVEPVKQRYYPRNPAMQKIIFDEVDQMISDGVIEKSSSPWSSPVVLVKKATGKYRFCIDMRKLNACSEKDAYPLPQINAILEKLREAKYISTIDLKQGYWQVPLAKESRPLTAFTVPSKGLYQFTVMPFGLHSAGATFQRLLDKIIGPELEPNAFAYLDDIIVVSKTFKDHLTILAQVFKRLREAGMKLNPEKCRFGRKELKYLGHVVNGSGIQADPDKVRSIVEFPTPSSVRTLRSFLGLASWYRRFVENFSRVAAPLTRLTRKDVPWRWEEREEAAFQALKKKLTNTPILTCPDFDIPFQLQVDASNDGLGAALTQTVEGKEHVIAYASRSLSDDEKKYTVTEKECLALVWAVKKFRPYLEGYRFVAITDHQALKWLMNLQQPSGRLARWVLELQQFDFEIQYRKGCLNKVADALSRHPVPQENQQEMYLATTKVDWYTQTFAKVRTNPTKHPDFLIRGDRLLKRIPRRDGVTTDETVELKTCVPEMERHAVLVQNHDAETAGHLGIRKTTRRVQERYYWPGMRKDVERHVRKCQECQKYKVEQRQPPGKMYFRRPVGPWYTLTADLMGPFPRSKRGARYLMVIQDVYTKWVELAPLKQADAKAVAQELREKVLLRYGAPEVIITDNGSQFTAKLWKHLIDYWGIEHQLTAPYSPQGNPVERVNRVLKTMIAQYVRQNHTMWDAHLNEFRFAMNTATHDSTKYTPALLMLGRELKVPNALCGPLVSASSRAEPRSELDWGDSVATRSRILREVYRKCHNNLRKAFDNQSRYYNLRRRTVTYRVGDRVWLRAHHLSNAADSFAAKLAAKYDGPFTIQSRVGPNLYWLTSGPRSEQVKAHVKDLKRYVAGTP